MMMMSKVLRRLPISTKTTRRTFFASSTDHTTLLANATIHCIPYDVHQGISSNSTEDEYYGLRQYVLIPNDTPLEVALKVDKLHLARLSADKNIVFSPKVVQRTLGSTSDICQPLLERALSVIEKSKGDTCFAMASLDGLCKWTSNAITEIEGKSSSNATESSDDNDIKNILLQWRENDEKLYEAVKAIATGIPRPGHSVVGQGTYRDGEQGWAQLAEIFVKDELTEEMKLYQNNGGKLESIEHLADTTRDGLMYAGGAMAKFRF